DKHEFSLQAGTLGVEAAGEGPLFKSGSGSYLFKYRYSSLALASKAGLVEFAPKYQDLVFNLSMPTKKAGAFTLYGIGGDGTSKNEAATDPAKWAESKFNRYGDDSRSKVYMGGITHTYNFNKAYLYSGVSFNSSENLNTSDSIRNDLTLSERNRERFQNQALRFSTLLNYRLNPKNTIRLGGSLSLLNFKNFVQDINDTIPGKKEILLDHQGNTSYAQSFAEWKFRPVNSITIVSGVHYLRYTLNGNSSIEPRLSASYKINATQSISAGYGLHSKLEAASSYFTEVKLPSGQTGELNKNLDLSKAHHFVLAYDWQLSSKLRFKAETYYQSLFNVPVGFGNDATASALNADGFSYNADQFYNKGTGKNYGLELTLERFFNKGSYFMFTGSAFRSLYTDIFKREHQTPFDRKYLLTVVAGKEWSVGGNKQNLIQANLKVVFGGPYRFTPIDLQQSKVKGYTVYDYSKIHSLEDDVYFKPDLKIAFKKNRKHSNWTTGLDIVNVSGKAYLMEQTFDETSGKIKNFNDAIGMFPNLFYRLEF
ncbi:MAG: TonB-dependent receptor plug, partial [Daejeonella sp.]|nr:TonB-dependent receptor plug [Daejeonella sp.]